MTDDAALFLLIAVLAMCCTGPELVNTIGDRAVDYAIASKECP